MTYRKPDFKSFRILVKSRWNYIDLWLKRSNCEAARDYWKQAREFHHAAQVVNELAKPLPCYYAILNATKALLAANGLSVDARHGIRGSHSSSASLLNEWVETKNSGIFAKLARFYGCHEPNKKASLKELFREMPFLSRAYFLTYKTEKEVFVPVKTPVFYRYDRKNKVWVSAEVSNERFYDQRKLKQLPSHFEIDKGILEKEERLLLRSKRRTKWRPRKENIPRNLRNLTNYHLKARRDFEAISAPYPLWYMRKDTTDRLCWTQPVLIFAAMHRLSEISRYHPTRLKALFSSQANWLLQEFLDGALEQFIAQLACDVTGQEFHEPGIRGVDG